MISMPESAGDVNSIHRPDLPNRNGEINEGPGPSNQQIAEELVGPIKWIDEHRGYCRCPGYDQHSSSSSKADCVVYLNGAANIFCFHQSCADERLVASKTLRAALRDRNADPLEGLSSKELKRWQQEQMRRQSLELRASSSLPQILKRSVWPVEQIVKDSPVAIRPDRMDQSWKQFVWLFDPDDVVWIGNKFDSGQGEHQKHFRTAREWLVDDTVAGPFTCPATFRAGAFSRSNENVVHRRFLVVESDVLSKDHVGAVFRWMRDEVGMQLRAVVDTAGKSLHGWFDFPKKPVFDELQVILPQLGCDPGLFKASQPCRIPGALRNGKYQSLLYLNSGLEGK